MTEDTTLHEETLGKIWRAAWESDSLADVLHALYAQEINVGLQSFWDNGWEVWFGDDMNGKRQTEYFKPDAFGEIVSWLKLMAEELHPVLRHRRIGALSYV